MPDRPVEPAELRGDARLRVGDRAARRCARGSARCRARRRSRTCALPPRVAELRQRNAELGRPPERIDARRDVPHAVPRVVLVAVVAHREVALHAVGIHGELEAAAPVVVRVDQELDLVRRPAHVAPRQRVHDAVRMRIEHAHEDVEVLLVVRDLELGLERRIDVDAGSNWRNSENFGALCHTASSSRPSICGAAVGAHGVRGGDARWLRASWRPMVATSCGNGDERPRARAMTRLGMCDSGDV